MDISLAALLAPLANPSHQFRLLQLEGPHPDLVVERFCGDEQVCGQLRFAIDCLATDAYLDIDPWLETPLTLRLHQADGALRQWHGLCTEVAHLGSDGGLARYRLVLEPWTALLRLRRNAVIFQDQDLRSICETLFADYPQADYRFDVQEALPVRAITTQYRESDWDFVARLLADAGLAWRIEQAQSGEGRHTLVIFDPNASLPALGDIRFHRAHASDEDDGITAFSEHVQQTPNRTTIGSWHSAQVQANAAQASADTGALPELEVYVQPREGRFATRAQAQGTAQARLDALRVPHQLYAGSSSVRTLAAGSRFTLLAHPQHDGLDLQLLSVHHTAVNNLPSGVAELLNAPDLERGSYRNRFLAAQATLPLRALPPLRPTALGPQTALVVGLPDAAVTPNRDHQVRVQFGWQRGARPNSGGLTDTGSAQPGHAPGDHTSGTWVPVAEWLAGPNWGSAFLPRLGAEVLVEFAHGDIDQPRIVGQLYNGAVAPPFGGGVDAVQPGVLSGLHTTAHDGSHAQQWVLDDTPGQLRTRLHTTLGNSRLELGYLIAHQQTSRGPLHGTGFNLHTQSWANVHAGRGLLLSATARENARSTLLDSHETVAQLKGAERSLDAMHTTVQQQGVPALEAWQHTEALRQQIDPEENGHYSGSVNGQNAHKPDDGRTPGSQPVERFASPLLLAESPEQLVWVSPNSIAAHAGGHLQLTAQHDLHASAGSTFASVAGQHASLFTQQAPLKIIAANGPVTLQAHTGELELLADQNVTVTATDTRIDVLAQKKIVLQAGKTAITLEGGNITFTCPGQFTVKAGEKPFVGGVRDAASLETLPSAKLPPDTLFLDHRYHDDQGLSGARYFIKLANGKEITGSLDDKGQAVIPNIPSGTAEVTFGPMEGAFARKDQTPTPQHDPNPTDGALKAIVDRYLPKQAPDNADFASEGRA